MGLTCIAAPKAGGAQQLAANEALVVPAGVQFNDGRRMKSN
jgi:hypothetical protein